MHESFGARMRQRREQQQIALTTIAEQTKIKVSLLEAMERDDVSQWPSGIFRRAFLRAYAVAIGLDPDPVVREFLERYPDPNESGPTLPAIASAVEGPRFSGAGPATRFRDFVGSALESLSRSRPPAVERAPLLGTGGLDLAKDSAPAEAAAEPSPSELAPPPAAESMPPAPSAPTPPDPEPPATIESQPDLAVAAQLCTRLARADQSSDVGPLLQEAARILDAVGLIVWVWDSEADELRGVLAHGYSDRILAQLPRLKRDADNATASAFQSAELCVVNGTDQRNGALVVPLLTPGGCAGVLALELARGGEQREPVRALATIFAAQLAGWIDSARTVEVAERRLA